MVQYRLRLMLIIICMFLLSACVPGQKDDLKSLADMTPKEKATWMLGIYNAQTRDYKAMVARPDLTNDQKSMLRKKRGIMAQVYPMINTYKTYVDSGAIPTKEVEDEIIKLINSLTAIAMPVATEGG